MIGKKIDDKKRQKLDSFIDGYQWGNLTYRQWAQFKLNLSVIEKMYVDRVIAHEGTGKGGKSDVKKPKGRSLGSS